MIRCCMTLLVALMCAKVAAAEGRTVVVGVYQNAPKIMAAADGGPSGIFGELLLEIAAEQQWTLKSVQCDWAYCLQLLLNGEIDILPDVVLTEQRQTQLEFHQTPTLFSWSELYTTPGVKLNSFADLAGKRIAVLDNSAQLHYLQKILPEQNVSAIFHPVKSLPEAFTLVLAGQADIAVTNHYFGLAHADIYNLQQSSVVFLPTQLFFATRKNHNIDLLTVIETRLAQWQSNASSPYYQILRRWGSDGPKEQWPQYAWWLLALLTGLLLLALAGSWWLKRQVAEKTRYLQASEARHSTVLNSIDAYIYIKDNRSRYQYVNQKVADLFGCSPEQVIGRRDDAFFDATTCDKLRQNDIKVLQQGLRVVEEEMNNTLDNQDPRTFLSVKMPLRNDDGKIYALCGISTDITEHKLQKQEIHQLAFYDALTNLPNRRLLLDRLQQAVSLRERQSNAAQGALLFIDLDHFKDLNDTLGHAKGDQLLQQVAQRLEQHLRKVDTLARLGGDEFVILLTDLHPDLELASQKAGLIAEKVVQLLAEPFLIDERDYNMSASVGVVMFADGCNSYELLQRADLAMYNAKEHGRNGVRFFNHQMQADISARADIAKNLRLALKQKEFVLYFQPQLACNRDVVGAEVLLRWQHPELGMIAPAQFIPVAESSGQILQIGQWVLEQSCMQLSEWARFPDTAHWYLAVNISARQLHAANFVDEVSRALRYSGAAPDRLVLELTESQLLQDVDVVIDKMQQLTAMGVRFSLDDFGTGYSSLSYLKRLPLKQLKIDRSFVRDLLTDANDKAIIKMILALGQSMELAVIAEGVETEEQYQKLLQLGCQQYQGYFFGKPVVLDTFVQQHRQPLPLNRLNS
jgi:diguanylate cyclase (GGDEF)-like protein/PAS domain S-box-containing protein